MRRALDDWAAAAHARCGGRRTRPENLHVTLAFLGMVEQSRLEELDALARAVEASPFELVIDRTGFWKRSRIAWAGATTVPVPLLALSEELRARLSAAGLPFDPKPYRPHVTLARSAERAPGTEAPAPVRWPVRDFSLVHSAGGAYRVLSSHPLA